MEHGAFFLFFLLRLSQPCLFPSFFPFLFARHLLLSSCVDATEIRERKPGCLSSSPAFLCVSLLQCSQSHSSLSSALLLSTFDVVLVLLRSERRKLS